MSDSVSLCVVDAFAETPFSGNPAGVVLDADALDESQMQAIAREVNASETSFVCGATGGNGPPRLRWFTPTVEVGFCGHATLAAAHALAERRGVDARLAAPNAAVEFDASCGRLSLGAERVPARESGLLWWLAMPPAELRPDNTNPMRTCELLGLHDRELDPQIPPMRTRDNDVIYVIASWQRLMELKPKMGELADWCERHRIRGILVSSTRTLTESIHVASRFFAPAAGVPEDPATGSVHGPLAELLVRHGRVPSADGRAAVTCLQGPPGGRTALLRALVEMRDGAARITLGGLCHTVMRGEIRVPAPKRT